MNNFVQSWKFLVPFVAIFIQISSAARSREVYEYDECRAEYQEQLGVASGKIPDESFWASTSGKKRPPSDGRLGNPSGAWTAGTQNTAQHLGVDLGAHYIITSVATQGRQGSDEYVVEYFIEYSDDKKTWRIYTNEYGIPEMFDGNTNSWQTVQNSLLYPIVARYIRFSPQRWSMLISLRVEVTGCLYESYVASFNSESYIQYDLSQKAVPSEQNLLELRFRTNKPDGVLFYASGNQGDYITFEMKRGFLYFRIDLGSTQTSRGRTEVICSSLLDDNQWHDVVVTRNKKNLKVVVDRLLNKVETNGLFYRLDLDKYLYVGGLPYFGQDGVEGKYSFVGCIENINFDGAKLIKDARDGTSSGIQRKGTVAFACGISAAIPVTFTHSRSYLMLEDTDEGTVRINFDFRTHDENGLLITHAMEPPGMVTVKIDANGYVSYKVVSTSGQVIEDVVRNTDVLSKTKGFSDGLWHTFSIHVDKKKVNCTVDRNSKLSARSLDINAGKIYYIGSYDKQKGFRGCLRKIHVASKIVDLEEVERTKPENVQGVEIGSCGIRDRCTPNPCEHGGNCSQDWNSFYCRCDSTGYKGEMCHTSDHHISCAMQKLYSEKIEGLEDAVIDVDGSGPLKPFKVACETDDEGKIKTYVGHDSLSAIQVNGYQEPGSYVRLVRYVTDLPELTTLIERASSCQQYIEYRCFQSRLLAKPGEGLDRSYGWWVGRTYQPMYYWGGAAPGSFKCACGLDEKGCVGNSDTCNCDASLSEAAIDQGYLVHKDYLPVLEMHFGDTGTVTDLKVGTHKLGNLECTGDDLFDNVITFRKADATLEFATFEAEKAGDIWFQFRTTADDGIMIHNTGPSRDFIEIRLFQSENIRFRYDVGDGQKVLNFKAPAPLDDDSWHTVHVEHNRKQAWMRLDDAPEVFLNENSDLIRMLDLNGPLVVGAAVDGNDGFVGCMRGLRVNGILLDMKGKVEREEVQYGVSLGCVGKCSSNPCFNGGTCREGYSGYTCDCSYTPFRGWMCGREVGVNLQKHYMIRYTFENEHGLSASDFQFARIGFTTQMKQGYLMQMRNEKNTEYISVEINNAGGVKVAMDVGFERVETNTPDHGIDYTNGQQHVVVVRRTNKGRTLFVQVDNYPFTEVTYDVSESSDTILDDPKYVFIGNNDTSLTSRGFEGCIFQMQVDNIFPLKRAFQDPRPSYMYLEPEGKVREDMCGFEEYTQPPDPIETRPRGGEVINVTYPYIPDEQLSTEERIILGVVLALVFIIVIIIIILLLKNKMCEGGDYSTKEAKGAELADNPDTAVVYNSTGLPNIADKQEWFL